jgi:hypothetical protein
MSIKSSLRYSFRSEKNKIIFQFLGKSTTVAALKQHIEMTRGISHIEVVNTLTNKPYDKDSILYRSLHVEIRTTNSRHDHSNVRSRPPRHGSPNPDSNPDSCPSLSLPQYHRRAHSARARLHFAAPTRTHLDECGDSTSVQCTGDASLVLPSSDFGDI